MRTHPRRHNHHRGRLHDRHRLERLLLWSFDPGLSTSRTMCVMPALNPRNAVRWGSAEGSSLGKDLHLRARAGALFGRKPRWPRRGCSNHGETSGRFDSRGGSRGGEGRGGQAAIEGRRGRAGERRRTRRCDQGFRPLGRAGVPASRGSERDAAGAPGAARDAPAGRRGWGARRGPRSGAEKRAARVVASRRAPRGGAAFGTTSRR